jgi:hypothetical protein
VHDPLTADQHVKRPISRVRRDGPFLSVVTAPAIYSMILPLALLDLWITSYQAICFRAYRIARVKRSYYFVLDRQHLAYLNGVEKINCIFCGYANAVLSYAREIAARTEQYWCPIRHSRHIASPHAHYREFVDYGDAAGYHNRLPALRRELQHQSGGPAL